ncbi:hypothetical protein ECDEC6E_1688 [Escherichia coli DEC6E]|uniref:hypothetical protein n=1 Tax=Escherichia coli TaxID=562 RepID=UPI000250CE8D|nr:hypothetical protein [Escherichia coli]EHV72861.1 hypothetical protein ECDEC6D_1750 [Escherichia coli DEC6D]EHV75700.1 hypothetical protein ECDEC6E_1688 [Escherichia coli DEC6E]
MKNSLKATPNILTRTLSVINFINMPHQRLYDSRLTSFVSMAARLKAVWQEARCAVPWFSESSLWYRPLNFCIT